MPSRTRLTYLKRLDHAEVPFAKRCSVNVPKDTKCDATRECREKKASRYEEKTREKLIRNQKYNQFQ